VSGGISGYDRETDLVDSIGKVINLISIEVVRDNGESTGADTEGGVDKGLRDTGGELGGVR
jgi:hypothetical protein